MLERSTVQRERDAALQALSDASAQLSRIAVGSIGGGALAASPLMLGAMLALSPADALADTVG